MEDPQLRQAEALMQAFAQRTGLTSDLTPRRYLWTDAFAVCNFLSLAQATGEQGFVALALAEMVAVVDAIEAAKKMLSGIEPIEPVGLIAQDAGDIACMLHQSPG